MSRLPNRTSFEKGVSGNPAGKPQGAEDRFGQTRSAKRAAIELHDRPGNDAVLLEAGSGTCSASASKRTNDSATGTRKSGVHDVVVDRLEREY